MTRGVANGTGKAIVKTGGDSWFFLTADYAFGHALEADTAAVVEKNGGKVVGRCAIPSRRRTSPRSCCRRSSPGRSSARQRRRRHHQRHQAGVRVRHPGRTEPRWPAGLHRRACARPEDGAGPDLTEAWYWDQNDNNRAFAKEFAPANKGNMPTMVQAGVYSSVLHYLKAVHELKSDADGAAVVAKMKSMPTDDRLFGKGTIRQDGRKIHDMFLFEVKKPEESKAPWDYYKVRATIPAAEAFRPLARNCPLVADLTPSPHENGERDEERCMFELIGACRRLCSASCAGLINGAFYALLSLGLAVIFGLMNVINFTHGAQYMMGAFCSYMLLAYFGIPFWGALVLAPIIVGITGIIIERIFISRLYHLDHLYGLLLTFGLALVIQGLFRQQYARQLPYTNPIPSGTNLGSCSCPGIAASSSSSRWWCAQHPVRSRRPARSYLRAATERPDLVQAFGIACA
jgi:hypothetical protein